MKKNLLALLILSALVFGCKKSPIQEQENKLPAISSKKSNYPPINGRKIDSVFVNLDDSIMTTYYHDGGIVKEKADVTISNQKPQSKKSTIFNLETETIEYPEIQLAPPGPNYHKIRFSAVVTSGIAWPTEFSPGYVWIKRVEDMMMFPMTPTITAGGMTYNTTVFNTYFTHQGVGSPSVQLVWQGDVYRRQTTVTPPITTNYEDVYPMRASKIVYPYQPW
uniref:hypothetical protein n=1 Tax=Pedobacter schmidteae TaxID=2201271 RepID=UPI000EB4A6F4|nr:hypothetical protein [Pedobacter schmidteae]